MVPDGLELQEEEVQVRARRPSQHLQLGSQETRPNSHKVQQHQPPSGPPAFRKGLEKILTPLETETLHM